MSDHRVISTKAAKMYVSLLAIVLLASSSVLHSFAAISVDRIRFTYEDCEPYRNTYISRMNCYGYAMHVYCNTFMGGGYKQQPGEFCDNGVTHSTLSQSYKYAETAWRNLFFFVHDRMLEDFWYLNHTHNEYNISEVSSFTNIPPGYRIIAMVIRQNHHDPDFHFYVRDDDGNWSHKPGHQSITNLSFDSRVEITDSNFMQMRMEGEYDDGLRFYLINKPYIVDYGHEYVSMTSSTDTVTPLFPRDRAGDSMDRSAAVTGNWYASFDYPGDEDFFSFIPNVSGNYRIETNFLGYGNVTNIFLFDENGLLLWYDLNPTMNASLTYYLEANKQYFFQIVEANNRVYDYIQYVYRV